MLRPCLIASAYITVVINHNYVLICDYITVVINHNYVLICAYITLVINHTGLI